MSDKNQTAAKERRQYRIDHGLCPYDCFGAYSGLVDALKEAGYA